MSTQKFVRRLPDVQPNDRVRNIKTGKTGTVVENKPEQHAQVRYDGERSSASTFIGNLVRES